ncbi:WbqC family protein [Halomonas elongata]|uniref:WbqC family protein n=1 Tax=Halomonas elongata (strain ATCC 33173 / DSM 2581 / NBRC 15536 / NCIMB 2198 / 1H9) TaxID=768066 RepID=A0A1R4A4A1_HALED|nr:WbqC family protein [Halomonas elongata]WBF19556.1 WbqC family protein [Halomonas elongata]WPU48420.1 WbqC family protein [Halomonas elongata DSM 2581]SJK83786.1 WbqC family protein [Halomonas elongata DSM 2581]
MTKLAVMQPYLFPYVGYFQLMYASDKFVIYDDVNYIKQGYINRNTVLSQGQPQRFTVPVPGASSNKKIKDLYYSSDVKKTLSLLEQSYSKSPYFNEIYPIVHEVLVSPNRSIASLCEKSYQLIFEYLGLELQTYKSSDLDYERLGGRVERLVSLCKCLESEVYINSPGGRQLYAKGEFLEKNIELKFIKNNQAPYYQGQETFFPYMSIIDVMMWCSPEQVVEKFEMYEVD